jgi:hypothetical protein
MAAPANRRRVEKTQQMRSYYSPHHPIWDRTLLRQHRHARGAVDPITAR